MFEPNFFSDALADNSARFSIRAEALILQMADGQHVLSCSGLELREHERLGHCELTASEVPRPDYYKYWGGEDHDRLYTSFHQVVWQVRWRDHSIDVVHLEWDTGCGGDSRDWVVADSKEIAESFVLDVQRRTHAPSNAILVFADGRWGRSRELYSATQSASFDDLVLSDNLKDEIRKDFSQFLTSEERYERLGIAWRRGALLIGPPGNGKTHCVRALVNELNISCLYVQSLSHQYYTPEQMWKSVFERARGLRPCILVLEDLDSLVSEENRSFFLNQMDGFEQNHGMIVLATTNYPEKIDSAIIDRPSRFDRKYHFDLPTLKERLQFLERWQQQLADETGWKESEIEPIASATSGFSFAYLKELIISSVTAWIQDSTADFVTTIADQARVLQRQMKTESIKATEATIAKDGRSRRTRPARR